MNTMTANSENIIQLDNVTINTLIHFTNSLTPVSKEEVAFYNVDKSVLTTYLNNTKTVWSDGKYYLGGQIKMGLDDPITLDKIREARQIGVHWYETLGGPCNSAEAASIYRSENQLNQLEMIVNAYLACHRFYLANILLYDKRLCFDVTYYIAAYLIPK
jgi:hypothetical protein